MLRELAAVAVQLAVALACMCGWLWLWRVVQPLAGRLCSELTRHLLVWLLSAIQAQPCGCIRSQHQQVVREPAAVAVSLVVGPALCQGGAGHKGGSCAPHSSHQLDVLASHMLV